MTPSSVQSLSHVQLCNPMDGSMPGLPVHHQLLEFTQTHVHWVGDAIQPSHPLSSPSPLAFNLSQHQGLFQWVSSLHQVATVLELQRQSFQWIFRTDLLQNGLDSLWPHGLQHTRLPCPSPSPRICSDSCPLSRWCHPTILSSVIPFSSCLLSFPASRSFLMSQFMASGGQSIGASASVSVLPVNIQDWFPLGWTDWISLQSKGFLRVFFNTTVQKHQFFGAKPSLWFESHIHT